MLLAFSILRIQCQIHKTEQSLVLYSEKFSKLPNEHVSRPQYALLAAFCVSVVCGLFIAPTDNNFSSGSLCLLFISVVAKVHSFDPPSSNHHDMDPVWRRTNSYICSLINQTFFLPTFTPIRVSRYNLAKYIVLDFCDHWIETHQGEDHVLNVPKRSDCLGATIQSI
jgi:hypothetical protein